MQSPAIYAKAVVAATGAATAGIGTAVTDGVITGIEWVVIGLTTVGSAAAVYAMPNKDPEGEAQDESVQPPEHEEQTPQYPGAHTDLNENDIPDRFEQ